MKEKRKNKPGAGRPRHQPTDATRHQVRVMCAMGLTDENMGKVIGITHETLRLHYKDELENGANYLNTRVAGKLFEKCMKGDTASIIFWCKTRLGWREKADIEENKIKKLEIKFVKGDGLKAEED